MSTERVQEIFDDWAQRGRAEGMEAGHGFSARVGFERLGLGRGDRYLDVGCGNGYTVRWAAALVGDEGHATGIDLAPEMVRRARAASAGLANVSFAQAAFPEHELEPGSFQGIFSMEVLYYLADVEGALREIAALLAPGGRFVSIVDYYKENPDSHGWPDDLGCPMSLLSMRGWQGAFEAGGFEVLEQQCLQYPLAPGEEPSWKHTQGSLLTLGRRRG